MADSAFCDYKVLEEVEKRNENFLIPDKRIKVYEKGETKSGKYIYERFIGKDDGSYECTACKQMKKV